MTLTLGIFEQALHVLFKNVTTSPTQEQSELLNVPTLFCTVPWPRTDVLELCGTGYQLTSPLSSPGLVSSVNNFELQSIFSLI